MRNQDKMRRFGFATEGQDGLVDAPLVDPHQSAALDAELPRMCNQCRSFSFDNPRQHRSYTIDQPGECVLFGLKGDGRDWCEGCNGFKALKKVAGRTKGNRKPVYSW